MNAEIIAIGDEITSGQKLDTNSQWLAVQLENTGVRVLFHTAIGDELDAMVDAFRIAADRAELILITGGLGPTADDLTRQALADATGFPLEFREEAFEHVRSIFERRGYEMPESNRVQALFPVGSRMIDNPSGTAPGIDLTIERNGRPVRYFAMPGVPSEMRLMWQETVADAVRRSTGIERVVLHHQIHCFGAGESKIESMLPDMIRRGRIPRVGITASDATITLRITAEAASVDECRRQMISTIETIDQCLGDLVYGTGEDRLQDAVGRLLERSGKTLAVVEWGTRAAVCDLLAESPAAQSAFRGGWTIRDLDFVRQVFGLEIYSQNPSRAELRPEDVVAIAEAGRRLAGTDLCLAVGPAPHYDPTAENPSPVLVALAAAGGDEQLVEPFPYTSSPAILNTLTAKRALNFLRHFLLRSAD